MTRSPDLLEWVEVTKAVRRVVPSSILVSGRQDAFRPLVVVSLRPDSFVARMAFRGPWRRQVLAAAAAATADAPAGLMVRVEWR